MNIYYRGSLSSCNYACSYCPFAKTSSSRSELRQDRGELERFEQWLADRAPGSFGVLITPWGEALVHRYYRQAMTRISHLPRVHRIAIQTNLSAPLEDLLAGNRETLALWTTYHPSQSSLDRFLARCRQLDGAGLRYSVGVVGLREHFAAIEELRHRLRPEVYLWVNAYKRDADYYRPDELLRLQAVDPYFHWNTRRYQSAGRACGAGDTSFAVDGHGNVRRCHFSEGIIGNLYAPDFESCLRPRLCPVATCGCHIGYIHRPELRLEPLYGDGLMERIPASWPVQDPAYCSLG